MSHHVHDLEVCLNLAALIAMKQDHARRRIYVTIRGTTARVTARVDDSGNVSSVIISSGVRVYDPTW